jgi:hypothetical protein
MAEKWCTEVITQLLDFRNRNDSARGAFAPSIHPCYDPHFTHTSGCQQPASTLWCHKTVVRLILNWISYQTRIPFVSFKNPESEPWNWVGESINNSCSICMTMLTCDPCQKSGPCSWARNYSNYKSVTGGSDNGILHVLSLVFWTVSIILCFKVNVALQKLRLFQCQVKGQRGMHLRAYSNYPWSWKRNKRIHHTRTFYLNLTGCWTNAGLWEMHIHSSATCVNKLTNDTNVATFECNWRLDLCLTVHHQCR